MAVYNDINIIKAALKAEKIKLLQAKMRQTFGHFLTKEEQKFLKEETEKQAGEITQKVRNISALMFALSRKTINKDFFASSQQQEKSSFKSGCESLFNGMETIFSGGLSAHRSRPITKNSITFNSFSSQKIREN